MKSTAVKYSGRLFVAFAIVALAFILTTVYVNWRTLEIGRETHNVSADALPGIAHLNRAEEDLNDLQVISAEYAEMAPDRRNGARDEADVKLLAVDRELASYARLSLESERAIYDEVPASLRATDQALRRQFNEVDSANPASTQRAAETQVRQHGQAATEKLQRLMRIEISEGLESAARIEALRNHTAMIALVLDGLAALVTVGATSWVWTTYRAHSLLLQRHGDAEERRATELEAFGRRVAHDILSPLSSLTYCLTAFKPAAESDPALGVAMTRARSCVQRAQTMVDGIFAFARSGGLPEPGAVTRLQETIEQIAEDVRSGDPRTRPEIEIEVRSELIVACHRGVLTSIVSNLLRNAEKYMRDCALRRITVRACDGGSLVRVEVEDTGPGIPANLYTALFEPYVRADTTQPGLGLGLATVKRLCVAHGGEAGVHSKLGRGSTFWFTLPKGEASAAGDLLSATRIRALPSRGCSQ